MIPSANCFVGLDRAPALLLAVSGGPDSMALMLLASRWAAALARPSPALHVATVDHGLRRASAAEAVLVAAAAARLGLSHATLAWTGAKPVARLQERARAARYALLARHAGEIGATHVLTGHHADDQAETVLMRLARGSGIGGLAGMRRATPLAPGLILLRPLLGVPKAGLVALCEAEGIACVDDPSNRDPAYARTRLRAEAERLAALGLDRAALTRLARRAERADAALEAEAVRMESLLADAAPVIARRRQSDPGAAGPRSSGSPPVAPGLLRFAGDDGRDHRGVEPEILLRLLRRAIEQAVPGGRAPRLERLETLTDAVAAAMREGSSHRATLGGARIVVGADATLSVSPAPPRRGAARSG